MIKTVLGRYGNSRPHWVGDGFPVRTLVSYDSLGAHISPFLLLDYAGPHRFEPTGKPRGVGLHPHRGFETVTVVYEGEVEHRDSTGHGGVIGPGDVQWMTAGGGILHEELHSDRFTRTGGPFQMVQLWVNLPAKHKMTPGGYQSILNADIPAIDLPGDAGRVRVIAGTFQGTRGPARTFTDINVWDARLKPATEVSFALPEGHTAMLAVLGGQIRVNGTQGAAEAEVLMLGREGTEVDVHAPSTATLLILTGQPIDEPIVGHGPFVMNSEAEIGQAFEDFRSGRFGKMAS